MAARLLLISIAATLAITVAARSQSVQVKGPPVADQRDVKKIGRIGETVRLTCPVSGYPTPMVEWTKNGEKVDFTWERHKAAKRFLKIKNANEDDTGVFVCKGINGFGSDTVRVELIIVDPRQFSSALTEDEKGRPLDVAPPVFTHGTKISKRKQVANVGDTFKVSCEALGSPQPEIFWFKDGQHIDEPVHYKRGKSTVEFAVMGTADSGVYTCRARNLIGEKTLNYTLEVRPTAGATHAIVTEVAGPANTTVAEGDTATLACRVKSIAEPHIKWLKRLSAGAPAAADTLSVGSERYRVLDSSPSNVDNVNVNNFPSNGNNIHNSNTNNEYLNRLVLENVRESDAGMYICFVTNSGFGALTYKSMNLRVVKDRIRSNEIIPSNDNRNNVNRNINNSNDEGEPLDILIPVICLSVVVFILIVAIMVCVVKNRSKAASASSAANGTLDKSSADESVVSDVQRPFVPPQQQPNNTGSKFEFAAKGSKYPKYSTSGKWGHTVYPASKLPCGDSGFDAAESTAMTNQYEVPFAHLAAAAAGQFQQSGQFGQYNGQQFLRPAALPPQPPLGHPGHHQYRAVPTGQSSAGSAYSRNLQHAAGQYPYPSASRHHQQYLSDYESQ